ncbi:HTH-type transcriptional repressor of iron proteins A [Corynebacterium deserti GIMN1.010]|uniref:HTH-type transcriptional regulator RipA n=1 Tax=Corynebacterium deserti GIMN1.010 TaxID=931089 RepID=A0A0M4CF90_9CORY|nr:helix-turn-helix transcriptional regulator [Corynebacterium deserti]ALC05402.1 HTH-type transcriptional repressor of iron proteins A [Corynebacterium deserti GIMN1.010]
MSSASLLWCQSGVATVTLGQRVFTLVAGDLLFAPEDFMLSDSVSEEVSGASGLVLEICFNTMNISGTARRIHLGYAWNDRLTFEYSRSLFGEDTLSSEIARLFTDRVSSPPLPAPRKARSVAQVLVSNPADQTSLEEFAEAQGVSARTLQRQFLKSTGYSFSEWRAAQRVCVAASLLAHDFSISVVANLVGFAATSSLTRAFRRHTGATPSSFTTGQIGMGAAGYPPRTPASTTFAQASQDQQLWIYSGTATVTTPGYCRFLGQGDMVTIPAGTQTRIDVAAGSIAFPVPVGLDEWGMDLSRVEAVHKQQTAPLTVLEQSEWATLSDELLNTPVPVNL